MLKANWTIVSHNGGWFRKPTTILKTVRLPAVGAEIAQYESSLHNGDEVEHIGVHQDYMDAVINHRFIAAQLGLKKVRS